MIEKLSKYSFRTTVFLTFEKIFDYIRLFFFWKIRLGHIGKSSIIKKRVMVNGSGKNIIIGNYTTLYHRCFIGITKGSFEIGNNSHLGVDVYVNASEGKVKIGDNVSVGPKSQIYSYSDDFESHNLIGEIHKVKDVVIGNNILIGAGVTVLPGVIIEEGSVIGAGSIVNKNIPAFSIAVGIPAKVIKQREK